MQPQWYYAIEGRRYGPITFAELRDLATNGQLQPVDQVWQPEFGPEWRNAGQVNDLFTPEPPAPQSATPQYHTPLTPNSGMEPGSGMDPLLYKVAGHTPSALRAAVKSLRISIRLLFQPFDFTRWFSIGFCAWLATVGTQFSFNPSELDMLRNDANRKSLSEIIELLASTVTRSGVTLSGFLFGVCITLLFALMLCHLRSHGEFMLLHRWYKPNATIRECWSLFRSPARELFFWRVYFFLIVMLLLTLDGVAFYGWVIKPYISAGKLWNSSYTQITAWFVAGTVVLLITAFLINNLTRAFVIPMMYWQGASVTSGWLTVFKLCNAHPFAVLNYLICGGVCVVISWVTLSLFIILTCCIGVIPLMLPYFNAVMVLPFTLWLRGYSLCFINQWRPDLVPDHQEPVQ